jgi:hypothetical protein
VTGIGQDRNQKRVSGAGPIDEEGEKCVDTGLLKRRCPCLECKRHFIELREMIASCRDIEAVNDRLETIHDLFTYLIKTAFEIEIDNETQCMQLIPPLIEGNYWTRCPGCGWPILIPHGEGPDGMLCEACLSIAEARSSEHLQPKYYDDLFEHIALCCNLREKDGKDVWDCKGNLAFTRGFCNTYGFDFDAVKARLNVTGGYCDCEVLLNSMDTIPLFDKLPPIREAEATV